MIDGALSIQLTCITALRLADGVRLTAAGSACIPAATLKGRLRAEVERLAAAFEWPTCNAPEKAKMCYPRAAIPACPVCDLFGSAWQEGRLYFEDLTSSATPVLLSRSMAAQSRTRGVRLANTPPIQTQALPAGSIFRGAIRQRLNADWQLALVVAGLHALNSLGAGYGVGWGLCRVEVGSVGDLAGLADALARRVSDR